MISKLLSPKVDFVFKKIFGSEKHPKILISFLNAVIKSKDPIVEVEIKSPDIDKDFLDDKFSRLDVKAITNLDEIINIEIQLKNENNMIKRSLYYWSKLYEEQLEEGDNYNKLSRTVCINILDFKYLKNDRFHNGYRLKEIDTNEELTDIQEIHFIEIPKLKKIESEGEVTDMLVAWTEFLKDPESEVIRKLEFTNQEIREAKDELFRLSRDSKERELYYIREKSLKDRNSAIEDAENNKALEIARNLLDVLDNETISIKTGLSIKMIENLRNKNK